MSTFVVKYTPKPRTVIAVNEPAICMNFGEIECLLLRTKNIKPKNQARLPNPAANENAILSNAFSRYRPCAEAKLMTAIHEKIKVGFAAAIVAPIIRPFK